MNSTEEIKRIRILTDRPYTKKGIYELQDNTWVAITPLPEGAWDRISKPIMDCLIHMKETSYDTTG